MKRPVFLNLSSKLHGQGELHIHGKNSIFFGNDLFNGKLEHSRCHYLHQVHGHKIIPSSFKKTQADGHFTSESNTALFIKTADCMPVFISQPDKIIAMHIGWRGLMQKIFSESFQKINSWKNTRIFVGPHIHKRSFQLNTDLTKKLLRAHNFTIKSALAQGLLEFSYDQKDHYFIDLTKILMNEINQKNSNSTLISPTNTYSSPKHFSHRRNPRRVGQNFSFIIKSGN